MEHIRIDEDRTADQLVYRVRLYTQSDQVAEEISVAETAQQAQYTARIAETALAHIYAACDPMLMYYLQRSDFDAPLYFEAHHEPQQWWNREQQKENPGWPYWIVEHDWSGYGIYHLGYFSAQPQAQALCAALNRVVARIQKTLKGTDTRQATAT